MITAQEVAAKMHGKEYGNEQDKELFAQAKEAGLVIVFGYSDDGAEFRGAIYDETFSEVVYLDENGIKQSKCDEGDACPYYQETLKDAATIKPIWDRGGISWQYETSIPHVTFDIMEDDDIYCRGIVFALADVA
jgi:hypothetical protein